MCCVENGDMCFKESNNRSSMFCKVKIKDKSYLSRYREYNIPISYLSFAISLIYS